MSVEMEKVYFPPFHGGDIDCSRCEKADCHSRDKHQRNRKDFTYESCRCPRLPDRSGFAYKSEFQNQRDAYAFVTFEVHGLDCDSSDFLYAELHTSSKVPPIELKWCKNGWYYPSKDKFGQKGKQLVLLQGVGDDWRDILKEMDLYGYEKILVPCEVDESYFLHSQVRERKVARGIFGDAL